jgi:Tfp pilus assembly protein PilF
MRSHIPSSVVRPPILFSFLLVACGQAEVPGGGESQEVRAEPSEYQAVFQRDDSEAARELRRNLDLGVLEGIESILDRARPTLGVEEPLLEARLFAIRGQDLKVTPMIEQARSSAPTDPRVYATAAELHAASGRLETAREEVRRGLEACGSAPELLRAQAFIQLSQQGGAQRGLALLERAREYDAEMPFMDRATAQAHLLLAKRALSEQRTRAALEQVKLSLSRDPFEVDARLLFADILAANGEFPQAVSILEELESEGHDRGGELALMYKRAAMAELVLRRRDQAIEFFRLAREAGLTDEELGTGGDILRGAAEQAMKDGVTAFEKGDLETARMRFEHSLRLDDSLLLVHGQLAVVLYRQQEFLPAATHWRRVLDDAIEADLVLPEPVHIFMAKALYAADEKLAARTALEAYLEREPEGKWHQSTSALLSELP